MKYKLNKGGFEVTNFREVFDEDGQEVGEMTIQRRSGWRGGPSYMFLPNAVGEERGLRKVTGVKVREILRRIGA